MVEGRRIETDADGSPAKPTQVPPPSPPWTIETRDGQIALWKLDDTNLLSDRSSSPLYKSIQA
ncbi:hypothetical protein E2C01_089118 [Portunus trituberculatus]|uniref:Uncharacterized protein n=1 Tax=Portunus trituberculatus TaxID=210409 RepID=A0A5B7J7Z0_PORTR|nr:hypothetical protein [Portunus trituberculatus]